MRVCENACEMVGAFRVETIMASLSLRNITKIYPHSGDDAKKAKKKKKTGKLESFSKWHHPQSYVSNFPMRPASSCLVYVIITSFLNCCHSL